MVKIHKVLSVTDNFFLPPNGQRLINLIETLHGSLNSHEWPRDNFLLTIPMQYQTEKWREEKKNTNQGITSWSHSKHYSTKYHYNNCMADSHEWPRDNFLLTIPMQYQTEKWREEKKNTNQGITSWSHFKHYSTKYHYNNCMNCMADSQ